MLRLPESVNGPEVIIGTVTHAEASIIEITEAGGRVTRLCIPKDFDATPLVGQRGKVATACGKEACRLAMFGGPTYAFSHSPTRLLPTLSELLPIIALSAIPVVGTWVGWKLLQSICKQMTSRESLPDSLIVRALQLEILVAMTTSAMLLIKGNAQDALLLASLIGPFATTGAAIVGWKARSSLIQSIDRHFLIPEGEAHA
jgi:hypothetical protein